MPGGEGGEERRRRKALALSNEAADYLGQGKPEKALPLLRRAIEHLPEDADILLNLGGAYVLLGRHEEAIAVLERAAVLAPDRPMVWCNLGAALLRLPGERTDADQLRAMDAFRRALALEPRAFSVAYNLGLIHRDRAEWAEAARCFALAVAADPGDRDAQSLLGKMRARLAEESPGEDCGEEGGGGGWAPLG